MAYVMEVQKPDVNRSKELFEEACEFIAGGVSSTARGRPRGVIPGVHPMYIQRASGSHLFDVDGNEFVDYLQAYGAINLGYAHPKQIEAVANQLQRGSMYGLSSELEIEAAKKFVRGVPGAEQVMFSNTGSEATSLAVKVARAFTGKEKIVKFEGHYHGWLDWCMVDSTWKAVTTSEWVSERYVPQYTFKTIVEPGVPRSVLDDVIVLPWNELEVFENVVERRGHEIALVILEPTGPSGCPPEEGLLEAIRRITEENDIVLIWDEVKTGFRLAFGGAQERCGITPDLSTFGKAMGNGFPVSAVAGKREILELTASYRVSHDGTYNGNALCMAAVLANLAELEKPGVFPKIYEKANRLIGGIRDAIEDHDVEAVVIGYSPMSPVIFTDKEKMRSPREYPRQYPYNEMSRVLRLELLKRGIHILGRLFVSVCHTEEDIEKTIEAFDGSMKEIKEKRW